MSMTREEAFKKYEEWRNLGFGHSTTPSSEVLVMAMNSLRPVSREQVEKMRGEIVETVEKGRMKRVFSCCGCDFTSLTCWITPKFCPSCGAPMTDEAVETIMKRMEEMRND